MNKCIERLYNGIIKENPTFVLMLGMCPTLAVTTSAKNGLFMGLTTMVVLSLSNAFISLLRRVIPQKVRIPAFIVIIASFVTLMELLLEAFLPSLYDALGIYIPLIVVNCIILGRAESYASKNSVLPSIFDGIGMGLGFSFALTCIGALRELLGAGSIFDYTIMPQGYIPISIFIMAPGAFFVLAVLVAIQNKIKIEGEKKGKDMSRVGSGCSHDCLHCTDTGCEKRFFDADAPDAPICEKKDEESTDQKSNEKKDRKPDTSTLPDSEDADEKKENAEDEKTIETPEQELMKEEKKVNEDAEGVEKEV